MTGAVVPAGGGTTPAPGTPAVDPRPTTRLPDPDPGWLVEVWGDDLLLRRVHETLLTVADGRFGTRGTREELGAGYEPLVMAAGVFDRPQEGHVPRPLIGPTWFVADISPVDTRRERRILDLREGVLHRVFDGPGTGVRSIRFACLHRPGVAVSRIEHDGAVSGPGDPLAVAADQHPRPGHPHRTERGGEPGREWVRVQGGQGGITATASTTTHTTGETTVVERIAVMRADPARVPDPDVVVAELDAVRAVGVDALLADHRRAWGDRWENAAVDIEGDPEMERAVRFSLFHLMASVADTGEAAVGARGLSGPAYAGHVFWDADVFVLPFLAATHPPAARAMLEYRLRRRGPARRRAREEGRDGLRFPWESAGDGTEATPTEATMPNGETWPILTGEQEEHIVADVAWAAWQYALWSGDRGFLDGPGRELVVGAAEYWASRIELGDDGLGHIRGVIGPDEYHETVDDNAYTNVMARWCLRRGAELVSAGGAGDGALAARWRRLAARVVDGRRDAGGYEQFAGYDDLEPLLVSDIGTPPLAADVLLGHERLAASQIVKQPDVMMLHHLVPGEMRPGSFAVDLDHYLPRTAHGSSLSPAVHASLLARAGRPEEALGLLRLAAEIDLGDRTSTTAGGLHVATMGGVWQALAIGFLGLAPTADGLLVDPMPLPRSWTALELRIRRASGPLAVRHAGDRVEVAGTGTVRIGVAGAPPSPRRLPLRLQRKDGVWTEEV